MSKEEMPETFESKKWTLEQGDFIEWVLKNTNDKTAVFRVYQTDSYILVGIDKKGLEPEPA